MSSSERAQLQDPEPQTHTAGAMDPYHIKKPTIEESSRPASSHTPPVIVHVNPPKIFHTTPQDFMSLVQLLTGNTTSDPFSWSCTPNFDSSQGICETESKRDGSPNKEDVGEDDIGSDPLLLSLGQLPPMPPVPSSDSAGFLYSPDEYSFI